MANLQVANIQEDIIKTRERKILHFPSDKTMSVGIKRKCGATLGGANALKSMQEIQMLKDFFLNYDNHSNRKSVNYRNYALVVFALNSMKRAGDVLATKISDIFNEDMTFKHHYYLREQKTSKSARVYINESMREAIRLYFENDEIRKEIPIEMNQPLFLSRQRYNEKSLINKKPISKELIGQYKPISIRSYNWWLKEAQKYLKFKGKFSTHSLRKSGARIMYEMAKDDPREARMTLATIQEQYGHNSQSTTLRYLDITADESDMLHEKFQF